MKSLPLLHYHQSISSSTQDPNPKQGKIFLRLKTCILLLLLLVLHQIVSSLGKHPNELKIEVHTVSAFPRVNYNNYLHRIYSWKKKVYQVAYRGNEIFHGSGMKKKKHQNQMLPNLFPMTYHQA